MTTPTLATGTLGTLQEQIESLAVIAARLSPSDLAAFLARVDKAVSVGPTVTPEVYGPHKESVEAMRELLGATISYQRTARAALWKLFSARTKEGGGALAVARAAELASILAPPSKSASEEQPR